MIEKKIKESYHTKEEIKKRMKRKAFLLEIGFGVSIVFTDGE